MPVYALTIFTGAFLLFQVQPLMGKYILPWFGGGPGVWTTCMLFFQVLLLGGYAYAHFLSRTFRPRTQAVLHLLLLGLALACLPIVPSEAWKPGPESNPTLRILILLTASLGLPYLVLSATGPLMQQWFSQSYPGRSPYRLYALSNAGSLLALLSYPFFFETQLTRRAQADLWAWGLIGYAAFAAVCALTLWRKAGKPLPRPTGVPLDPPADAQAAPLSLPDSDPASPPPSILTRVLWLLLPACGSVLLLAATNKLCLDVAVFPFLWVLPLSLYLLTFIICFDSPRWYARLPFTLALVLASAGICWALAHGANWPLWKQATVYGGGLFVCCMVLHGELYRLRPDPARLTSFYLMIAAGGALGGCLVAIGAPLFFRDYYELHWGLFACGLLFLVVCMGEATGDLPGRYSAAPNAREWRWLACLLPVLAFVGLDRWLSALSIQVQLVPRIYFTGLRLGLWLFFLGLVISWIVRQKFRSFQYWRVLACAWLTLGFAALATDLWLQAGNDDPEIVYKSRNFYGVLTVYERRKNEPLEHYFLLQHGRITHGLQFADPSEAAWPTTYYAPSSGVALGLQAIPSRPRRIGIVGLGTGTLTAYGEPDDYFRIYEIDPQVVELARSRFTYLGRCPADVDIALGDARLSLERESPQQFDLLALDAFSSDSIPVHLLTREAFQLYQRHVKTNGIIAVHISNHFLDLEPVVLNLARQFGYHVANIDFEEQSDQWWLYASSWMLLSRDPRLLDDPEISALALPPKTNALSAPLWTDDFASLFQILK